VNRFATIHERDRTDFFIRYEEHTRADPAITEKDFWVCWASMPVRWQEPIKSSPIDLAADCGGPCADTFRPKPSVPKIMTAMNCAVMMQHD
jgi:hypothetical protein